METQALAVASEIGGADLALSGTVRIGAPDGFGTYFLAAELGALAERHPGLTLQLVALPRTFSLSKREADIAVTLEQPTEGRLVSRKLTDYRLRLYASQDYLDRHGRIGALGSRGQDPRRPMWPTCSTARCSTISRASRNTPRAASNAPAWWPRPRRCGPESASASCTTTRCGSSRSFRSCCRTSRICAPTGSSRTAMFALCAVSRRSIRSS